MFNQKGQFSKKTIQLTLFIVLALNFFLLNPLSTEATFEVVNDQIECIIIKNSECLACDAKYNDSIEPFYNEYRYNESINFTILEAHSDIDILLVELEKLNLTLLDISTPPVVIFIWGDNQKQILDANNLELIYSTFQNILEDPDYQPEPTDNSPPSFTDIIDVDTLLLAMILVIFIFSLILGGGYLVQYRFQYEWKLKRISRNRLFVIIGLSILSLITLLYQFLDYQQGGCGCASLNLTKAILFRQYETWNIFGTKIPFSFLGIISMGMILIQIGVLSVISLPFNISISKTRVINISRRYGEVLYYFIMFQFFTLITALFYLLYLELFVIEFICLLCTLSQLIIILNTILVGTWSPFPDKDSQKDEIIT